MCYLLEPKSTINVVKKKYFESPLVKERFKLFLEYGIDPNIKGKNCLLFFRENEANKTIILSEGFSPDKILFLFILYKHILF